MITIAAFLPLLYFSVSPARGETYQWLDDKGVMHFSDDPSSVPRKYRKRITESAPADEPVHKPSSASKPSSTSTQNQNTTKDVQINEVRNYYEISGTTAQELGRQMSSRGFAGSAGMSYYGYTNWYVTWYYRYHTTSFNCSIATTTAKVDVTFRLPKWVNSSAASAKLRYKWDHFFRNLEHHEDGHKNIGVQAAKEIVTAINSMEPLASCEELGKAANALGQQILEKWKREEIEYDARTNHGISQGAKFP